jgi:hypothetical protein
MAQLTREEFLTHIEYVRNDIGEIVQRLDTLNGRTRTNEQDIAVLKDRDQQSTKTHAYIAGALAAFLTAAAEALRHYLGAK